MIDKRVYQELERRFGGVSSWAIWKKVGNSPTSNTGDMSVFKDPNELAKLHNNSVVVGVNVSVHAKREDGYVGPWANFHSCDNQKQKDFKLRHGFDGSLFYGSYMTDLIKNHPEVDSSKVFEFLKQNPQELVKNLIVLREELAVLGGRPILVALGGGVYEVLKKEFGSDYKVVMITHPSARKANNKEVIKDDVDSVIAELKK